MSEIARDPLYRRHHLPTEIIAHAMWLYFRFPLSLRMVEDMLAARGTIVAQSRALVTDKLGSYASAGRELTADVDHHRQQGLNNQAENPHQPIRRREKIMKRFKSQGQLQRFTSIHDLIAN
ncbi:DDE-type integrase/transposase/recombinase, partial [Rhizobiaceae sp. 2RAB30]